jgi:hypothetical protein
MSFGCSKAMLLSMRARPFSTVAYQRRRSRRVNSLRPSVSTMSGSSIPGSCTFVSEDSEGPPAASVDENMGAPATDSSPVASPVDPPVDWPAAALPPALDVIPPKMAGPPSVGTP